MEEEINLKELFNIFWEKKVEIIIIMAIFLVIGLIYSYIFVTPKYTSATTLILTQVNTTDSKDGDTQITQSDVTLNSNLVSTYSELIKRNLILSEVISNLNLQDISEDDIRNNISVSSVSDTEMIEIKMTHENPNYASTIANEIANVFSEKIKEVYNINNVYIVDKAKTSDTPSNINHVRDIVIFMFIGFVIACGYAFLCNMLDNTIKTEQDIEKTTGLLILAVIPNYDVESKKGGKRA